MYFTDEKGEAEIEIRAFECVDFDCVVDRALKIEEIHDGLDQITPTFISFKGKTSVIYHKESIAYSLTFSSGN